MYELAPGEWIWLGITTVHVQAIFDYAGLIWRKEAFSFGFVREVNDDKPGPNGDYDCEEAFKDLGHFRQLYK